MTTRGTTRLRALVPAAVLAVSAMVGALVVGGPASAGPASAGPVATLAATFAAHLAGGEHTAALLPQTGILPPDNPLSDVLPTFLDSCADFGVDSSLTCQNAVLANIDAARALEGVGNMVLPADYGQLTPAQQLFVVTNLERADRGLPELSGMSTVLDQAALTAAGDDTDPVPPDSFSSDNWASNWAGGTQSALVTDFYWMYDDGLGSFNLDCTVTDLSGCWGHRDDILAALSCSPCVIGTAFLATGWQGSPSWTELLADTTGSPALDYTWDQVVGEPVPPVIYGLAPSTGSTFGGTAVTITGNGLTGATVVHFGSATATIGSCTETVCDVTAPAGAAGGVTVTVTTPVGTSSSATSSSTTYTYASPASPGAYHPLDPARICDTRDGPDQPACAGATTLGPGGTLAVTAAGHGGVPASGVVAVVVNVTATDTTAASFLTVFPGGQSEPTASNLNWVPGQTVPNLVTVALSASGVFDVGNFAGAVDVVIDVEGYYAPAPAGTGRYDGLSDPARICDTRAANPSGLSGTALTQCQGLAPAPGGSLDVAVDGLGGVPSTGVAAVVLNVTAVDPSSSGHLTVYPDGTAAPLASNVNFTAGEVVPNRVIAEVGSDGSVDILSSAGAPDIVVDVAGWFTDGSDSSATGTEFTPAVTPTRVCDTRTGLAYATPCAGDGLGAGTVLPVTVDGTDAIPAGVTAVVLNVTVTDTTAPSHLDAFPAGQAPPPVSDLNWTPGRTVPNLVIAEVGTGGQVELANFAGSTDVVVDVVGWFS